MMANVVPKIDTPSTSIVVKNYGFTFNQVKQLQVIISKASLLGMTINSNYVHDFIDFGKNWIMDTRELAHMYENKDLFLDLRFCGSYIIARMPNGRIKKVELMDTRTLDMLLRDVSLHPSF